MRIHKKIKILYVAIMITTITSTSPPYDDKRGTIWQLGEYQAQLPLHHYPVAITLLPHIDPCNATKRGTTSPTI